MTILVVVATPPEADFLTPLARVGKLTQLHISSRKVMLLVTGIGMVNTAYHLGRVLPQLKPDLAIQVGVAGAFNTTFSLGEVVEVREENYADMGAESPAGFLALKELGFPSFQKGEEQFFNRIVNSTISLQTGLREARGITVNTAHGEEKSIQNIEKRLSPDVESMEGAAFFQCCEMANIPYYQFRGISNYVTTRDKSAWELKKAATNVQQFLKKFLNDQCGIEV